MLRYMSAAGARPCLKAAYRLLKSSASYLRSHPKLSQLWTVLFKLQRREAAETPYRREVSPGLLSVSRPSSEHHDDKEQSTQVIESHMPTKGASPSAICTVLHRCTAEVSLEAQLKGSGYIGHPAVTDNCMQLGPGTAALSSSQAQQTTRVVAGLGAFSIR